MTFEEIHHAITGGIPAASREAAEAELDVLVRFGSNVETLIALRIAEAQAFCKGDPLFLEQARAKWRFKGEKTIFHYIAAGRVLIALRDFKGGSESEKANRTLENQARKCYAVCVTLEETKLEAISVLNHKRGIVEVMNFIKLHFQKEWTVKELKIKLAELYGFGKKRGDSPDQLVFNFLDVITDDAIADLMEQDCFDTTSAMTLAYNGAMLCRNANRYLAQHADAIGDDELDNFEELSAGLAEAKRHVDELLAARKRPRLGLK